MDLVHLTKDLDEHDSIMYTYDVIPQQSILAQLKPV